MTSAKTRPCFISAGEYSGDLLAASLAIELKHLIPKLSFYGIVGDAMRAAGVYEIASIAKFNIMGVSDVLCNIGDLRILEREILDAIDRLEIETAILVDYPGFHFRLADHLKRRGIRVIQYVAPKLWAWGAGRIESLRNDFDLVLGILPFEEQFFRERGVKYEYIGCPILDRTSSVLVTRQSLGITSKGPVIALLPGSRIDEVRRLLPIFLRIQEAISAILPDAQFYVPVASNLGLECVENLVAEIKTNRDPHLHFVEGMSLEMMAVADACVVASGTATLECALVETPQVVCYALSAFNHMLARNLVKTSWVSLVNLLRGRRVVNEYIQDIPIHKVAAEVAELVRDTPRRREMLEEYRAIKNGLRGGAAHGAALAIARTIGV